MAITQGAHHIGLTVPNIDAARDFFIDVLEFKQVGAVPEYPAYFVSDGTAMLTLWQAADPESATPFDRKNQRWSPSLCLEGRWGRNIECCLRETQNHRGR